MTWQHGIAYFIGGFFLANFFPHYASGMLGRSFPTPFAKPPFRGLSSPVVNVLWGLFNLAVAYVLLVVVGNLAFARVAEVGTAAMGFGLASLGIARSASRLKTGLQ